MDERKMLEKIKQSAQDLNVPEALKPEQVRQQLKDRHYRRHNSYRLVAAVACLCICFGATGLAYQRHTGRQKVESTNVAANEEAQELLTLQKDHMDRAVEHADTEEKVLDTAADDAVVPVKKLGKMYTLATNYGDVYDAVQYAEKQRMIRKEEAKLESSLEDMGSTDGASYGSTSVNASDVSDLSDESNDFSSTNLQVEGVDESDFVKTDGKFIYVVQDAQIQVLDVRGRVPAAAGAIQPDLDEDTDRICEMYVADQLLTVVIQKEKTELDQMESEQTTSDQTESEQQKKLAEDDRHYVNTSVTTTVVTYDIADPQKPVLKDTAVQDGWYKTSRKIGSRLYLFTDQSFGIMGNMPREEAVAKDTLKDWIPSVNGKLVDIDSIYLQKDGSQGLLMASIDLANHNQVLDMKLLVNHYAELYVSNTSVYLYNTEYAIGSVKTRIARFALEADGAIRAKAAKTVKGSIQDTFAIHERDGYLQVLTSVTSSDPWENRVYVLDENMQTVGKLTGLAKGEQIYAARFTGDIGYFVTYRNTDPLFTVDFSNPAKPKVIGELKVTGFSEYLHFWSDNKLLGIGFETNPDSGETIGVKLSMFDISDPVKVKEEAKLVLKGVDDCNGIYDYKEVLVHPKKNIIAFTTDTYNKKYQKDYRVFSYEDGKFISRIERALAKGDDIYANRNWRSVYVGDMLYLVSEKKTIAFAMNDEWKEIGKLVYGWEGSGKERVIFID